MSPGVCIPQCQSGGPGQLHLDSNCQYDLPTAQNVTRRLSSVITTISGSDGLESCVGVRAMRGTTSQSLQQVKTSTPYCEGGRKGGCPHAEWDSQARCPGKPSPPASTGHDQSKYPLANVAARAAPMMIQYRGILEITGHKESSEILVKHVYVTSPTSVTFVCRRVACVLCTFPDMPRGWLTTE